LERETRVELATLCLGSTAFANLVASQSVSTGRQQAVLHSVTRGEVRVNFPAWEIATVVQAVRPS